MSSVTAGFPPCARIISANFSRPAPLSSALTSFPCASSTVPAAPPRTSMCAPRSRETSRRSPFVRPARTSIASFTSRALPTCVPRGCSIPVTMAVTGLPASVPISTMALASSIAPSSVCMMAPLPVLTSRTIASLPAASFLDMIELAISGRLSTVAVTSRSAYSVLSAGASMPVCPITATPMRLTCSRKASPESATDIPGIDSSLSSVPPVCPSPRPLIFATGTPQAATSGARISVVVSPTPPVECLSTLMPGMLLRSTVSPLFCIASVRAVVSRAVMPLSRMAMSRAAS